MLIYTIDCILKGKISLKECIQLYEKNVVITYKNGTIMITKED